MIDEILNFEKALEKSEEKGQVKTTGLYILVSINDGQYFATWGIHSTHKINSELIESDEECLVKSQSLYKYTTGLVPNKRYDRKNESCSLFAFVLKKQAIEDIKANMDWSLFVDNYMNKATPYFNFGEYYSRGSII